MRTLPILSALLMLSSLCAGCRHVWPWKQSCLYTRDRQPALVSTTEPGEVGSVTFPLTEPVDHIHTTFGEAPDPREAGDRVPMSRYEVLRTALINSQVVRVTTQQNETAAASTVYDYPIADAGVQQELGAFDTIVGVDMTWERLDRPPGVSEGGVVPLRTQLDRADWDLEMIQPLASGGTAAFEFDTDYFLFPTDQPNPNNLLNPQFDSPLTFSLTQPLLRGGGYHVNQAPIRIAAARTDQTAWEFKDSLIRMVADLEGAYWGLHAKQEELTATREVLELNEEVVRLLQQRVDAEIAEPLLLYRSQTQLTDSQIAIRRGENDLDNLQTSLRNLLGIPPTKSGAVFANDTPIMQRVPIDWQITLSQAYEHRPDMMRQRLAARLSELELLLATNQRKVQLDVEGLWRINGIGTDLEQSFGQLNQGDYTDWQLGFNLEVPLQRRTGVGRERAAQLAVTRSQALLQQVAHNAAHELASNLRNLEALYDQYEISLIEREAARKWRDAARARFLDPVNNTETVLISYQQALRAYADAYTRSANLIADYNIELVELEAAQGTLLQSRSVLLETELCCLDDVLLQVLVPEGEEVLPEDLEEIPGPQPMEQDSASTDQDEAESTAEDLLRMPDVMLPDAEPAGDPSEADRLVRLPATEK